ncbi:MAG: DNA translocase FtsK [Chitinophagaceae bacterium]|nr:DNA translocase FtsK [Chitinophagaceae bacterium]
MKEKSETETANEEPLTEVVPLAGGKSINDLYSEKGETGSTGNSVKSEGGLVINFPDVKPLHDFKVVEKDELTEDPIDNTEQQQPDIEKQIVSDLLHQHQFDEPVVPVKPKPVSKKADEPLELEINTVPEIVAESTGAVVENLPPYEPTLDLRDYKYPSLNLLETHGSEKIIQDTSELENHKNQIIGTLRNYSIEIQKISATIGPTVTLYEIVPAAGIRISKIKNLEDDIALSLAALGIRIIATIPGKGTIGIEVPNVRKTVVSMKTLLASEKFQHNNYSLPIAIGKKIDNENFIVDLTTMPHLLMAGATGQGKSVGLNAILVSLLYKKHPSQLKLVLIDPKKVELSVYRHIEKHFLAKLPGEDEAIITDTKKVVHTLNALCIEMDNRYDLLKEAGARNIKEYNEKFIRRKLNPQKGHQFLPFIVLVIDEFADLIMTAGKEIEMPIARLAQLARAVGIHLIIATQRPSVNIITGTIKANFPSRVAFKVTSKIDSRTILDTGGAEQLIGKGDMLISHHGEVTRLQCAFVDTPEVEQIVEFIGNQRGYPQAFLLPEYIDEKELEGKDFDLSDRDSLFNDAARLIVQNQIGSTSLLQRRMKLGYNRAGRLMDQLEAAGIVGPNQGSKARDVLIKTEMELQQHLDILG